MADTDRDGVAEGSIDGERDAVLEAVGVTLGVGLGVSVQLGVLEGVRVLLGVFGGVPVAETADGVAVIEPVAVLDGLGLAPKESVAVADDVPVPEDDGLLGIDLVTVAVALLVGEKEVEGVCDAVIVCDGVVDELGVRDALGDAIGTMVIPGGAAKAKRGAGISPLPSPHPKSLLARVPALHSTISVDRRQSGTAIAADRGTATMRVNGLCSGGVDEPVPAVAMTVPPYIATPRSSMSSTCPPEAFQRKAPSTTGYALPHGSDVGKAAAVNDCCVLESCMARGGEDNLVDGSGKCDGRFVSKHRHNCASADQRIPGIRLQPSACSLGLSLTSTHTPEAWIVAQNNDGAAKSNKYSKLQ